MQYQPIASLGYSIVNTQNSARNSRFRAAIAPRGDSFPKDLGSDEVLVKVSRSSICQTDRRVLARQKLHGLAQNTLCLGHEGGGHVVKSGHGAEKQFRSGQKVVFL